MCQNNSIEYVTKCTCGAITVIFDNQAVNSMPEETFKDHFPEAPVNQNTYNCDYCVNKWGIDLCGCGSGEKVGECKNDYDECRNSTPAQYLEQKKQSTLWAR